MKASGECVKMIKRWEGFRAEAYLCPAGAWTIGYGHTGQVRPNLRVTRQEADTLLAKDLQKVEAYLNKWYDGKVTQSQFDALCDFCFNLGVTAFHRSTLKKRIDNGEDGRRVTEQMRLWRYAGGKESGGLLKRREEECELWLR